MQVDADDAADDDQIRVFDESEHRKYGDKNAKEHDRIIQQLIAGTNCFQDEIGDKPCGDAGDGCPNTLFGRHAAKDGGMLIGAVVPLDECDQLYGARGE